MWADVMEELRARLGSAVGDRASDIEADVYVELVVGVLDQTGVLARRRQALEHFARVGVQA